MSALTLSADSVLAGVEAASTGAPVRNKVAHNAVTKSVKEALSLSRS